MDIYSRKRRWKILLVMAAIAIITASLWYTGRLVRKMAMDERRNVEIWAEAVSKHADFVVYSENLFTSLQEGERERVMFLATATQKIIDADLDDDDIGFYTQFISSNDNIPVIWTDDAGTIKAATNVDFNQDSIKKLSPELIKEFSVYEPLLMRYSDGNTDYYYYKDSKLFTELKVFLDEIISDFFDDVTSNSSSVPVIITDCTKRKVMQYGKIPEFEDLDSSAIQNLIAEMQNENKPIEINLSGGGVHYIFYKNSYLLTQFKYYPYLQFAIFGLFLLIGYLLFDSARRSEQSRVWAGMAKETAHQLGTPISSLMAWTEILKLKGVDQETIIEIEKDINRLDTVTARFSKIGSATAKTEQDIVTVIHQTVAYLKTRTSKKINYQIFPNEKHTVLVPFNRHLFGWVIENLCKNAIDAMEGKGTININITEENNYVLIDISDTGKGISRNKFHSVFQPGYTNKQRGWGLGLSLSKRIINEYHKGRIFIKNSIIGEGTVFRIVLNK